MSWKPDSIAWKFSAPGVDTEFSDPFGIGRDGDEMPGHRLLVAQLSQDPFPCGVGVGQRFQRPERLRADDEQRFFRIQIPRRLHEVGTVDVRDEAENHVAPAVVAQRFIGHDWPEVRAADADIDDVAYRPA
jgi:hypothetical protein